MSEEPKLADLRPIERITLPTIGELSIQGLTIIVGPNSSGKSQLLRDIYLTLAGEPRKLVVAETVKVARLDYAALLGTLQSHGYLEEFEDDSGNTLLRPRTTYVGMNQSVGQIEKKQGQQWFDKQKSPPKVTSTPIRRNEFLYYFGRLLVTALFLENRLVALNQVGYIDFEHSAPTHDLHALHLNDDAKSDLLSEIQDSFGCCVWPDLNRGTGVGIRVSEGKRMPSAEEIISYRKREDFRYLEVEGDGLKSYVAICVALLLGRRPVCLVDEPEMCLHPPQAYNLGRFIGKIASSAERATFVSTHSSHVLRGVIQTAHPVQIIRLTRRAGKFQAYRVDPKDLQDALEKPTMRAETVLDGIFAQAVVVLESDTDRTVYQAVWETMLSENHLDIHFAPVGGLGGLADTCRLYRALNIPIAIVADLDMLTDTNRVKRLLTELSDDELGVKAIVERVLALSEEIRKMPPTVSPLDVTEELEAIKGQRLDWEQCDDVPIRKRIVGLASRLDRMRGLKHGGINTFAEPLRSDLESIVRDLEAHGVFVVPVGELEWWLADHGIKASRKNKWAWANEAAQKVRTVGSRDDDVWQFLRRIGKYLLLQGQPEGFSAEALLTQTALVSQASKGAGQPVSPLASSVARMVNGNRRSDVG